VKLVGASARVAAIVGVVVVSHWFLDLVVHRPDLPLWPGGPLMGLGLWNSILGTLLVEGALLAVGLALYTTLAPAKNRRGEWGLWGLTAFVGLIWVSGPFSPPPPSPTAVATVGLALWILPIWAWRVDANRGRGA
jgi:hypothetical protein